MAAATPASELLNRNSERELLDTLLADALAGNSAALVLGGEPGVGKTALLHYAARQARGFRVAQVTAVGSEMELPFAGFHHCARRCWISSTPFPRHSGTPYGSRSG